MKIKIKGKLRETVSVQMSDLLPFIKDAISEEMKLDDSVELHLTSNTPFLLFNVIRTPKQKLKCSCNECIIEAHEARLNEKLIEEHIK